MDIKLLTRTQFRESVFARDNHKCVVCDYPAVDAHHIMERRLWSDGGFYNSNGVSLCEIHHMEAEETNLSCSTLRQLAKIKDVLLPEHLYSDIEYDKWANPILPNGTRLKGELFHDESVQKILKQGNVLYLFSDYVKYPRTYHLPWSDCVGKDDRIIQDFTFLKNNKIVVTEKMDGENTTMYNDYIHARSLDSKSHPSQSWIRNLHGKIKHEIPQGWRICGENLFAKHSIKYNNLKSFFYIFSIWNDKNICLSWKDTVEFANLLDIPTVPIIIEYEDWNELELKRMAKISNWTNSEGYVVRIADEFSYFNFKNCVTKYVRKNHVIGTHHWKYSELEFNSLGKI